MGLLRVLMQRENGCFTNVLVAVRLFETKLKEETNMGAHGHRQKRR